MPIFICLFVYFLWPNFVFATPDTSDRISIQEILGQAQKVKVQRGREALELGAGSELKVGDEISTVERQIVNLTGYDGSRWKVAPSSMLKIEARKPDQKNYSFWVFGLRSGSMWGQAPKPEPNGGVRLKVKLSSASLGIRGTEYLIFSKGEDEVDVLEGTVLWGTSAEFEPGTFVEVKAGESSKVRNGKAEPPTPSALKGPELLKKYNLAELEEIKKPESPEQIVKAQECLRQGLGWKSRNNSSLGECYH